MENTIARRSFLPAIMGRAITVFGENKSAPVKLEKGLQGYGYGTDGQDPCCVRERRCCCDQLIGCQGCC
jgi:hypothetical protein